MAASLSFSAADWENQTIFKDTVLGYIAVPKALVRGVIDHPLFQRLHDIAQTGMETLYPGATHNRFCHSVGVYHLGKEAFRHFRQNIRKQHRDEIYFKVADTPMGCERVWNRWQFLFEVASLLHDCGHSPLSHSLEFLYDIVPGGKASSIDLTDVSAESIPSNAFLLKAFQGNPLFKAHFLKNNGKAHGAPHERMSACMLVHKDGYRGALRALIGSYIEYSDSMLLGGVFDPPAYGDPLFTSDLEFMVRCIIGYEYSEDAQFPGVENANPQIVAQLRNCIIHLLNSVIDVDNIDYSIRDATASGYKSTQVDYERLLKANTIALAYEHENFRFADAVFDYSVRLLYMRLRVDDSLSMTLSGSATLLIRQELPPSPAGPSDPPPSLAEQGLEINGDIIEEANHSDRKTVRVIHLQEGSSVSLIMKRPGILEIFPRDCDKGSDQDPYHHPDGRSAGAQLHIRSGSPTGVINHKLTGELTGRIFVGANYTGPNTSFIKAGKLRIYPAYHKSALSVIQGALDAANFEAKWVYSHHVTTYSNNFLCVHLLSQYAAYQNEQEFKAYCRNLCRFLNLYPCFLRAKDIPPASTDSGDDVNGWFDKAKNSLDLAQKKFNVPLPSLPQSPPARLDRPASTLYAILLKAVVILNNNMKFQEDASSEGYRLLSRVLSELSNFPSHRKRPRLSANQFCRLLQQLDDGMSLHVSGLDHAGDILGMPDPKTLNGVVYHRTSDADLRSMYHALRQNASKEDRAAHADLFDAIEQYESRCYLRPLWKSHAEYFFYTRGWKESWFRPIKGDSPAFKTRSGKNMSLIQFFFFTNLDTVARSGSGAGKDYKGLEYTFFSDSAVADYSSDQREFWGILKNKFGLKSLVYVPQRIKHKQLPRETYVIWKDRVVTLSDIGFYTDQEKSREFFYFYYSCQDPGKSIDAFQFMDFFRAQLELLETKLTGGAAGEKRSGSAAGSPVETAEKEKSSQQQG